MNTLILILIALSAVSIGLSLFILTRIKHVVYLLEQPIVKKMTPEMKLKTVKVDDADDSRRHNHRQGQGGQGQNSGRPQGQRPEGQGQNAHHNRDRRPEGQGQQAPRGDRPERNDRPERGERNDRGERNQDHRGSDRHRDRDRDRGPRQDRGDRGERGERQRPRLDVFSNEPAPAQADGAARTESTQGERPALAPRRPLAASMEREDVAVAASPVPTAPELPPDAIFVGDDGDVQHGRRSSVKKKPRFEIDEEEAKTEENKVQA